MSATNNVNQLGQFVVHLHGACTHLYRGEILDDAWLNDDYSGVDDEGRWYLILLHPRWCPQCIQERSQTIRSRYEQRLAVLEKAEAHEEKVRVEMAYLRGVRDGRINALSVSFNHLPFSEDASKASEDVEEVGEMIEQLVLGRQAKSPVGTAAELAAMMAQSNIAADELSEEILMYLMDEEAYNCGVKEGMIEQARMEWGAFFAEMGVREELFAMALA